MKQIQIMVVNKRKMKGVMIILTVSTIGIYLLISLYFHDHYFFHTEINGVDVSLKAHDELSNIINSFINGYKLELMLRNGKTEVITSHEIGMQYNSHNDISQKIQKQKPLRWIGSIGKINKYYVKDLFVYNKNMLDQKIKALKCLNSKIIEPKNVSFHYSNGSYQIVNELNGNKIDKEMLIKAIQMHLLIGRTKLDLEQMHCYKNPEYTVTSTKTKTTLHQLNKYVSAKVTYQFGNETQLLDGDTIHKWLYVDENLEVILSKQAIMSYIQSLSKKYNTVGIIREFQTSTGKVIDINGGLYGWKIDNEAEADALYQHIQKAEVIEKEPAYSQKAFTREGNEIGDTYIEINITKQMIWLYKNGQLIIQGAVVTGNPYKGNSTVLGVYMVNYKQKNATLTGPGYEARVTYWMPFFGNMGLHDASWRRRFGGDIYRRNGTHGCVNAPFYLAKTIYDHIEEGIPVILYEEP